MKNILHLLYGGIFLCIFGIQTIFLVEEQSKTDSLERENKVLKTITYKAIKRINDDSLGGFLSHKISNGSEKEFWMLAPSLELEKRLDDAETKFKNKIKSMNQKG